ncbi:MAG: serine/threonine-protein kinase [Anaerolineae bacterium]
MSLIPGQVIYSRYQIIALLSEGGMGAVYEALDITLGVRCALKEMLPYPGTPGTALPQLREQFLQEAQLLAALRHPNLPRVTDHFEEDGNAYLVMDFIHGKRLDEIIDEKGKLSEDEVFGWARQLMEALAHCHEQGVIHRDVKPQNVVIAPQGQVTLVDFGLAKLIDPDDPHTRTVMRGLGTPEYAPPEQYDAKKGSTDARTDVYSLGATLYHALTGEPPPTVTERVVDPECLVPLRQYRNDVSETAERVLMKAMALQPSQRFQSIAEMHEALFGSPLPMVEAESTTPSESATHLVEKPPSTTILLPRIGIGGLRVDRRLGAALVAVGLVSLATIISLIFGRINTGGVPTATATLTAPATITSTHTPTVTPSSTATPTPSPTLSPSRRQPTEEPNEFEGPLRPVMPSPTPTQYVPPPTYTPTPTSTPQPEPRRTRRPTPTPTSIPTNTPAPTNTPIPTETPVPTPTSTVRPTPTPQG